MRVRRVGLVAGFAAFASALLLAVPSVPAAQAAGAPSVAPRTSVVRTSAGFRLSWTRVAGATGYQIGYWQPYTIAYDGGDVWDTGYASSYISKHVGVWVTHNVSASTLSVSVPTDSADWMDAGGRANDYWMVRARNAAGFGPYSTGAASQCAKLYFVSARGSGQNPGGSGFDQGAGVQGAGVYSALVSRLRFGAGQTQMDPVNYAARPVNVAAMASTNMDYYNKSEQGGVNVFKGEVANIVSGCPGSRIVMFGFSQGAQAAADAFAQLSVSQRKHVTKLILFADPRRNPHDPHIAYAPTDPGNSGVLWPVSGTRGDLPTLGTWQATSWCMSKDLICNANRDSSSSYHGGPAYTCYQQYAAYYLALQGRQAGWAPRANTARPSCRMTD